MKLSIIIPFYNYDQWIGKCLETLLEQGLDENEYEIIVVDDGSTQSIDNLMSYVKRYAPIKYVRQDNARQGAARNRGVEIAKGEYIFFCDSDDYVATNCLSKLYDIANSNNLDVLFHNKCIVKPGEVPTDTRRNFDSLTLWNSGKAYLSSPPNQVNNACYIYIIKRLLIVNEGLRFRTDMIMYEDSVFFLDMMKKAGKVGAVDVTFYYYYQNPDSVMHSLGKKQKHELYIDNFITYVSFLKENKKMFKDDPEISDYTLDYMDKIASFNSFIILHNSARYATLSRNKEVVKKLKGLGEYPVKYKVSHKFLVSIMNIYPLWLMLCAIINLLPKSLRYKF